MFVLPKSKSVALPFGSAHLLRKDLLCRDLLDEAAVSFLVDAGMVIPLAFEDLLLEWEQQNGLQEWWHHVSAQSQLSPEQKWDILLDLWCFLSDISDFLVSSGNSDSARSVAPRLPCVPAASGEWIAPKDVTVYEHDNKLLVVPLLGSISTSPVEIAAAAFLHVSPSTRLNDHLYLYLTKKADADWSSTARRCVDWISKLWKKRLLKDLSKKRFAALQGALSEQQVAAVVGFTAWCIQRGLSTAVSAVVSRSPSSPQPVLSSISDCVVAEPFIGDVSLARARRAIFGASPVVAAEYGGVPFSVADVPFSLTDWRAFFETQNSVGPVRFRTVQTEKLGVWPSYTEVKHQIAAKLEIPMEEMRDIETQSKFGWKVRFAFGVR